MNQMEKCPIHREPTISILPLGEINESLLLCASSMHTYLELDLSVLQVILPGIEGFMATNTAYRLYGLVTETESYMVHRKVFLSTTMIRRGIVIFRQARNEL
jgi:hypothetical protein